MITPVRRALLSVHDKAGLEEFAARLSAQGVELVSSGGTARALAEAGLDVVPVETLTGWPEMLDGRVKTLHPMIHGGLLLRRDHAADLDTAERHGLRPIDLLVVNLYPFAATLASGAERAEIVEMIDVGGPAMLRAAAKNHAHVGVVCRPEDYAVVLQELALHQGLSQALRRKLASRAFAHSAAYDAAIADWLEREDAGADALPPVLRLTLPKRRGLRYGENPHQRAAVYAVDGRSGGLAAADPVQGKEPSYNNLLDADAARSLAARFLDDRPTVVLVKHGNPCGVATADSLADAHARALLTDPSSAFGGIVATNRALDGPAAAAITSVFTELVVAPDADDEARAILARRRDLRLFLLPLAPPGGHGLALRSIDGGLLVQDRDALLAERWKPVTRRAPTPAEEEDLRFAWKVAAHVRSNAIVFARGQATAGVGAGQMSRVDSARIAALKAADAARAAGLDEPLTKGSVAASDAFFPFADGLEALAAAGATAVVQPGGSIRDAEVIAAADRLGMAMLFTGTRHFAH